MLVLTVKNEEIVHLICNDGREVKIKVMNQKRGQVKLAFDAPKEVRILRQSVLG